MKRFPVFHFFIKLLNNLRSISL